jgi:two-component system, LytTR family, sensor kinase
METDMQPQNPHLIREALKLGITYLFLTGVLFGVSRFYLQYSRSGYGSQGFSEYSGITSIITGIASFSSLSVAVWRFRRNQMIFNIVYCFVISAFVSAADFLITRQICRIIFYRKNIDFSITNNISDFFICWAAFFGWACVFLTLLYSFDVRDRERRLAAVREEALSAQMRALRYQVNPHFLFNTLNSIGGLIEDGSATRAERMVLSLSTFLRTTLTLDPLHDVPLSEELALQEEYLEIEFERFSDRMTFEIDMPDDVCHALVPSLILQPLIENAIKHGVCAMPGMVNISLAARRQSDRLLVFVENDMPIDTSGAKPVGMGVGLSNVSERLRARFQDDGRFSAGPTEPGKFRATLDMPWRTDPDAY